MGRLIVPDKRRERVKPSQKQAEEEAGWKEKTQGRTKQKEKTGKAKKSNLRKSTVK